MLHLILLVKLLQPWDGQELRQIPKVVCSDKNLAWKSLLLFMAWHAV